MKFFKRPTIFALLIPSIPSVSAIQALTNSPCAVQCGNVLGSTTGADIECLDERFGLTPGSTFKSCVECQIKSKFVDPVTHQTDLQFGLYNMRYAVSWCLFGFPNNTDVGSTPCTIGFSCGPLQPAFEYDGLSPNSPALAYCPGYVSTTVHSCSNCLKNQNDKTFLNNYAIALDAACIQQPAPGHTISLDGTVFSHVTVNITKPDDNVLNGTTGASTSGLTLGAKVGIAAGAVVVLLAITGFCIIWNGRRRRRRVLAQRQRDSGFQDWRQNHDFENAGLHGGHPQMTGTPQDGSSSAGGFFDSPASTRPLVSQRAWPTPNQQQDDRIMYEESPLSAVGEKAYFSPYSSNYSSPVSATDALQANVMGNWPQDRKGSLGAGSALGRNRSIDKVEREPEGDRIEMQNVAPVLLHPGNGRGQPAGLYSEGARRVGGPAGHF
ncbi:hypothetical protein GLAREA_00869 [Glarea lozoyensis ATCC 20868]|uniref:LPXTG-domain-containing protein n=1 Tax=Glarea lozoyensis (strain ATCC 20868 / MF5171) TaxID=1116229 RepID=S3CXP8_GLAL2|nr:uncharacterized protein GLAREA_00869 [Glarea lozoyensis ATCC 20868]EPE29709.1 hypothetical protein GLAREA_00869 [Glarea lozoyensis ATCC 20868]